MPNTRKYIYVYADWVKLNGATFMGTLSVDRVRGNEVFAFNYDERWLASGNAQQLDPELQLYSGEQFLGDDKSNFGVFTDSCPDRWGRILMKRREAILARQNNQPVKRLYESDYLLGLFDGNRMGALRFKLDPKGEFLNDNSQLATPPWSNLRELEQASLHLEEDGVENTSDYLKWLNMLISPGSSLGGARPKASVLDEQQNLWIAKFPSRYDDGDTGAWEMVAHVIAVDAGVEMSACLIKKFNNPNHTFLTKRFDRTTDNKRIHFCSAMTCLNKVDGQDDSNYLELAEFISINGCRVKHDLEQLWRRIVLSICLSNTDDHLRNHGFILKHNGWELSPAYDINPIADGEGLNLNINEFDNSQDLDLALSVISHFRLSQTRAKEIIKQVTKATSNWRAIATKYGISSFNQDLKSRAFRVSAEYIKKALS